MSYLEESYRITTDDRISSVAIKKDLFANLEIKLEKPDGSISLDIPEELVSKFVYAINRLTNS